MKVLVFGDIGGHHDLFKEALSNAGCGLNGMGGVIPEDTIIIQVGDLVDRGPDSDRVVRLVDKFITNRRWIQLIGNHEAQYLGGPRFETPNSLSRPSKSTVAILRRWYVEGSLKVAAGIPGRHTDILVTHAGLPFSFWNRMAQPSCRSTVPLLNKMAREDPERVFAAGEMLGEPSHLVGPVWASGWNELIVPWWTAMNSEFIPEMPFDQIHGHCTLFKWGSPKWMTSFAGHPTMKDRMWADSNKHHSSFNADGVNIMQCDPGLGMYASFVPVPVELSAESVYT